MLEEIAPLVGIVVLLWALWEVVCALISVDFWFTEYSLLAWLDTHTGETNAKSTWQNIHEQQMKQDVVTSVVWAVVGVLTVASSLLVGNDILSIFAAVLTIAWLVSLFAALRRYIKERKYA